MSERAKDLQSINLDCDKLRIERTLGVQWTVSSDVFGFTITVNGTSNTRRSILSTVSSIFDPLGFLTPFVLPAKKILQELCKEENLSWDEEIPEEYLKR